MTYFKQLLKKIICRAKHFSLYAVYWLRTHILFLYVTKIGLYAKKNRSRKCGMKTLSKSVYVAAATNYLITSQLKIQIILVVYQSAYGHKLSSKGGKKHKNKTKSMNAEKVNNKISD